MSFTWPIYLLSLLGCNMYQYSNTQSHTQSINLMQTLNQYTCLLCYLLIMLGILMLHSIYYHNLTCIACYRTSTPPLWSCLSIQSMYSIKWKRWLDVNYAWLVCLDKYVCLPCDWDLFYAMYAISNLWNSPTYFICWPNSILYMLQVWCRLFKK